MSSARRVFVVLKSRLASKKKKPTREEKEKKGWGWEDLESDILVTIFQRLDLKDLIVGAPLCCRSWYMASNDPSLWANVDLRLFSDHGEKLIPSTQLIETVFARRRGSPMFIHFHTSSSLEEFLYMVDRFPRLNHFRLTLPSDKIGRKKGVSKKMFSKLKELESMDVEENLINDEQTLKLIDRSCPIFTKLMISDKLSEKTASLICTSLPKLKTIDLSGIRFLRREVVLIILKGCEVLESLDLSGCGKIHGEDEILGIGLSRLKEFKWDDDHCSGRKVGLIDRHYSGYINGTKEMLYNKYGALDEGSEDYDLEFDDFDDFDDDDEFYDP